MIFNKHLELNGCHATFGASQSAWLRYDDDKILGKMDGLFAKELGTEIHDFARSQIDMRIRSRSIKSLIESLMTFIYRKYFDEEYDRISEYGEKMLSGVSKMPREVFSTVQSYINDGVGFCMSTEQTLVYIPVHMYGTADSISFRDGELRIHDLKTGRTAVHMDQLMLYAVWFCLEYKIKPSELKLCELRIYQNNQVIVHRPTKEELMELINRIVYVGKLITGTTYEGGSIDEQGH